MRELIGCFVVPRSGVSFPVGVISPAHVSLEFIGAVYQAGALKMVDVYPVVSSVRVEDCYNPSQSVDILFILTFAIYFDCQSPSKMDW